MDRKVTRTTIRKVDGEYVVKAYDQHGKRWPDADYFTNDKADAEGTAEAMVFTKDVIGDIDGGGTALALTGHAPFGDCTSIRHRLDAARAQLKKVTENADELAKHMPNDEFVTLWRHEAKVWAYAIKKGEALLARELANPDNVR